MFGIENFLGFLLAGLLLNMTPGADTIYILTRTISQGKRAGQYSVLGVVTGILVHTVFAALGLSALLAKSATAFMVVKYLGVAYLCFLGVKMLISKDQASLNQSKKEMSMWKTYRQGVMSNVLNPKIAIFFLAFFPQFIDPNAAQGPVPFLLLGLAFSVTTLIYCGFLASAAAKVSHKLRENPQIQTWMNKVSGAVFIVLGLKLAVEKQ